MIKALEIKTSMLFNLDFAYNTILCCLFLFFLIIDLYFLITAVIAPIFKPFAKLVPPTGIGTKPVKVGMETYLVIVDPEIRKCSI